MTLVIFDIETTGLSCMEDKVLTICCSDEAGNIKSFVGEDEEKVLRDFMEYLSQFSDLTLSGFNILSFDIPFVIARCLKHKVQVVKFKATDLRNIASGFFYSYNRNPPGKLGDWAKLMGIEIMTERGCEMPRLYAEKNWDAIKKHCEEDIAVTKALYDRLKACNLL